MVDEHARALHRGERVEGALPAAADGEGVQSRMPLGTPRHQPARTWLGLGLGLGLELGLGLGLGLGLAFTLTLALTSPLAPRRSKSSSARSHSPAAMHASMTRPRSSPGLGAGG